MEHEQKMIQAYKEEYRQDLLKMEAEARGEDTSVYGVPPGLRGLFVAFACAILLILCVILLCSVLTPIIFYFFVFSHHRAKSFAKTRSGNASTESQEEKKE